MSARFWSRCLRHLPSHAGERSGSEGVEIVRSKHGVTHRMILAFPEDIRDSKTPEQRLQEELNEQIKARQGR